MKTHEERNAYLDVCYESLDPAKVQPVLEAIREDLSEAVEEGVGGETGAEVLVGYIDKYGSHDWIHELNDGWGHMGWGMAERNWLRQQGYGEKYWPVENLDDYYVSLVYHALMDPA